MTYLLFNWLLTTLGVLLAEKVVPGVRVRSFGTAVAVAAVFGVLNALLGGALYFVLGIATLGLGFLLELLTRWVVNTVLLRLTDALFDSFDIPGWKRTFVVALIIAAVGAVGRAVVH